MSDDIRIGSHWDGCWQSHHECAVAEIARLTKRLGLCETAVHELEENVTALESERNELNRQLAAAEAEVEQLQSRCICELTDDDDEAAHECGWQVCGTCWNDACAAHKMVADQLKAERDVARAAARWLIPLAGAINTEVATQRWPWLAEDQP